MKKILPLLTGLFLVITAMAQHQELNEKPGLWKEKENETDSNSILAAFRKGSFSGHFRYFFMATQNEDGLTDYHAHAAGGGIKFESGRFRNFQVGVSGFFVFNIGSSDLSKADNRTGQMNRYEIGLFDIEDPTNKKDIDRLEELYLKYHFHHNQIILGKQLLNTPFINLQDGRMRPSEVEGLWAEIRSLKKLKIQGGYLYGMSPRSTVKWYRADESIGIYPVGVNENGSKSGYAGQLQSKGILLAGVTWEISKSWKLQAWNQWVQNIFNTALLQPEYEYSFPDKSKLFASAQLIFQQAIRQGGNPDPLKSYITTGSSSLVLGGRLGWKIANGKQASIIPASQTREGT